MEKIVTIINEESVITKEVEKILHMNGNTIVSFDYYSHKQLDRMNFKHHISDDFLNEVDKKDVNEAVFNIDTTWFENDQVRNNLTIDGINFGWLLVQEFYASLLSYIANFAVLLKIKEKFDPEILFVSNNFLDICKDLFPNSMVQELEKKENKTQQFVFDVFAVKYNLGPIPIVLHIPRKFFFTLRNYYEKIMVPIFNLIFSNFDKNKKTVLLVDFNPVHYENFLKAQHDGKKINTLLLNRRRIALWNFKAFNILRKNKCILASYEKFLDADDRIKTKTKVKTMENNLNHLFSDEDLFARLFVFKGFSFWKLFHNKFKNFCSSRFQEAIYEMIGVEKLLAHYTPKLILHFYEVALQEKILILQARKKNIPSFLIQHGTPYLSFPDFPKHNPLHGTLPLYSDKKVVVWGNVLKEYAIENGMKEENILVTGSLRHDPYFHAEKKSLPSKQKTILVALGGLDTRNVETQEIAVYERYEWCLKIIFETLKKIPDINKIVKLHPANMSWKTTRVEPIIRSIDSSVKIIVDADLIQLLQSSDVVISIGITTVLMEANILQKPTLSLIADDQDFLSASRSGYSVLYTPEQSNEFEKYLTEILSNKIIHDESIKKGNEFVNDYLANHGTASEHLASLISEY